MILSGSEKKETGNVELKIETTAEEFDEAIGKSYLKNKNRIGVPGFRKGKAPRKTIERMYGVAIFLNDALDTLIPDVVDFASANSQLDVVGYPKITDIDLIDNDKRAVFTVDVALRPEVKIDKYKGLKAPKADISVSGDEIQREIDMLRERNARLEPVTRPAAKGDIAVIDFEGFLDGVPFEGGKGENYELELGSGRFIPGFEDKVIGMEPGGERDLDLVFPQEYKKELAGKPVVFKVKLHEVKEKQLPEPDDEFAKDVSEFDTLGEFKNSIKEKLTAQKKAETDEIFENLIMEKLIEDLDVAIPEAMIEENTDKAKNNITRQVSSMGMKPEQYFAMMGMDAQSVEEMLRSQAEKQIKVTLALDEIAKLENITPSPDEIDEEYKKLAEETKTDIDKIKESVTIEAVEKELRRRAAAKLVIDSAKPEKEK